MTLYGFTECKISEWMNEQSCVQLKLGLILWCFNACTVVHAAGWGSTKQQCAVLVVTAVYSIFFESLLYYSSLTDTSNKTAWLCVTKQCYLLGSRLCYLAVCDQAVPFVGKQIVLLGCVWPSSAICWEADCVTHFPLHISGNIVPYPKLQFLYLWLWHCIMYVAKSFMVTRIEE